MINPVDTFCNANFNTKWDWSNNDGLFRPLGSGPGIWLWGHPDLIYEDREDGRHIFMPDGVLFWTLPHTNPDWIDSHGGEWDVFDNDYFSPRFKSGESGIFSFKDLQSPNCIMNSHNPDGKYNRDWLKSELPIVFMRNRKSTEIHPIVFKCSNDGYCCVDESKARTDGYCSTTNISIEEKLQIARDALKWLRDENHDGDRDVADKVDSTLKAIE